MLLLSLVKINNIVRNSTQIMAIKINNLRIYIYAYIYTIYIHACILCNNYPLTAVTAQKSRTLVALVPGLVAPNLAELIFAEKFMRKMDRLVVFKSDGLING